MPLPAPVPPALPPGWLTWRPMNGVWPSNVSPQRVGPEGPRRLGGWLLINKSSAARHMKFWDKDTPPTMGTDAPTFTLALPAITMPADPRSIVMPSEGIAFTRGLFVSVTVFAGDGDVTPPAPHEIEVTLFYL